VTSSDFRSARKVIVGLGAVVALACAGPDSADLWGYVDDKGVTHFAT